MSVTLLTATIPPRISMLGDLLDSVAAQTVAPAGHLIATDWPGLDNLHWLNRLARLVDTEWLCPTADDDLLLPQFLERMLAATDDADVIYSYCDLSSWPDGAPQHQLANLPFDAEALRHTNWIPGGCTLIRTKFFRYVGGYDVGHPNARHGADWYLWHRLLDADARFVCIPEELWVWRYHGANKQKELW